MPSAPRVKYSIRTTTYNGGNFDTSMYRAPAYKSQASGLTYAKSGGRNLGKSGTPTPVYCPQCAPLNA